MSALHRHGLQYILDTDACDYKVGCVLLQQKTSEDKLLVGYWNKSVIPSEKHYFITEKSFPAAVWSSFTLGPYLYEDFFTLRTEHHALKWILTPADSSEQLAHCLFLFAERRFEAGYRSSASHKMTDGVSCLRKSEVNPDVSDDEFPSLVSESSPDEDTAQASPREAVIVVRGSTKKETWTEKQPPVQY